MKKILTILSLLITTVFVLILGATFYVVSWDPNNHKEWLGEKFYEATGHNISFGGELELEIYPWLSFEVNQLEISNATGFGEASILSSEHARIRIKLMPMLSGQYEIDTVLLQNTSIHLEVNSSGQANWSNLFTTLSSKDNSTGESEVATQENSDISISNVFLGGINIQGANLTYNNAIDNQQFNISNFNMSTGELIYGQPVQLNLDFAAQTSKPELTTQVSLSSTIVYDLDNQHYQLSPLTLNSTLTGRNIPDGSAALNLESALDLDLSTGTLTIPALSLSIFDSQLNANITASKILTEAPSLQADVNFTGNDLAIFFQIAELENLARQISELDDNGFDVSASINIESENGNLALNSINANLLGANIVGNINALNINSQDPASAIALNGKLSANGPDLPTLLEVIGQIQGGNNTSLAQLGQKLSNLNSKTFNFSADFDADFASGNISIPMLEIDALGLKVNGLLNANNIQDTSGTINGELTVLATNLDQLMIAMEQDALGGALQSLIMELEVEGNRNDIRISPLEVDMVIAGDQIPNSPVNVTLAANTTINLDEETLNINNFSLSGLNLSASGNLKIDSLLTEPTINGNLQLAPFNLRQLLTQLNQELPSLSDPNTLERVSFDSVFSASQEHLELESFNAEIDDTNITGSYLVNNFNSPVSDFTLHIDQINADRYLLTETSAPNQVENNGELPFSQLKTVDIKGQLNIDQLLISNVNLNNIAIELDAGNGQISLAPISANLYQGSYNGTISLNAISSSPFIAIESTLQNVAVGALLQDFMGDSHVSGNGNISLALNGTGTSISAMKSSLNGSGNIELTDGILKGVDVPSALAQVETMIQNRQYAELQRGEQTPFDGLYSTLNINEGVVRSNDLLIVAPGFEVKGRGILVNLNNDSINFDLTTSVDSSTATRNDEEYDLGGYDLPIACSGTIYSPSCLPDTNEILQQAISNVVERRLGDFLQRALGVEEAREEVREETNSASTTNDGKSATQPSIQPQEQEDNEPADLRQLLIDRALERLSR